MVDKNNNTGLFTSFREILNKVQADVTHGIELIRCRNQYEGLKKTVKELYRELGEKVYHLYKNNKDPLPAIKEMFEELKSKESEMASLKKKIVNLEEKTTSKLQILEKKPENETTDEDAQAAEPSAKKPTGKTKISSKK